MKEEQPQMLHTSVEIMSTWDPPEGPLAEVMAKIAAKIEEVPADFRKVAKVEFMTNYEGGGDWKIVWERQETAEEVAARIAASREREERDQERRRNVYLQLKAEFENK